MTRNLMRVKNSFHRVGNCKSCKFCGESIFIYVINITM